MTDRSIAFPEDIIRSDSEFASRGGATGNSVESGSVPGPEWWLRPSTHLASQPADGEDRSTWTSRQS
jgi:hypothetical protein